MNMSQVTSRIGEQEWLKPVEKSIESIADNTLNTGGPAGRKIRNFLFGTWLGHPLHPVLTDVPVGAWTVSTLLDLYELETGDLQFSAGSDAAVGIGLLGAVASAAAGLNDWQHTNGAPRRVGATHALLNTGATLAYLVSWLQRRRGKRKAGVASGLVGAVLVTLGAYLGGHLVYEKKIGVSHAPKTGPDDFVPVLDDLHLAEGEMRAVEVENTKVLLAKREGRLFAIAETCSHLGGPLAEGKLEGKVVQCPWHGSRFNLEDGSAVDGPASHPQPCFEVRVLDGKIHVRKRRPL